MAFPAQLIIAKIARSDQSIDVRDEAEAIRWAVDVGARVINLSIGGLRDPFNPERDTFSRVEASAINYAVSRGAVLVAAVGNSDDAPQSPWPFASYPAALPHVIGVSALTPTGNVPQFSNRDRIYNDISAPGQEIYSTLPRALTSARPLCQNQGYSDCGPDEFRHAAGTSFAAPQVTRGGGHPASRSTRRCSPIRSLNILERTATDVNASNGCKQCPLTRDTFSGWGRLDVCEGGRRPRRASCRRSTGSSRTTTPGGAAARIGTRVTSVEGDDRLLGRPDRRLPALSAEEPEGQAHAERARGLHRESAALEARDDARERAAQSASPRSPVGRSRPDARNRLQGTEAAGWYYAEVKLTARGFGPYELTISAPLVLEQLVGRDVAQSRAPDCPRRRHAAGRPSRRRRRRRRTPPRRSRLPGRARLRRRSARRA